MAWDNRAFLQIDVGQHHAIAGYQPPSERVSQLFLRHLIPTIEGDAAFGHYLSPFLSTDYTDCTEVTKEKA
jgi:hypothetical protein